MNDKENSTDRALFLASLATFAFAILANLPSLVVPAGLSAEGDALDYRIPMLKWMLRHGSFPNWNWTFVDDYPMLGELLILPFFSLREEWARIVPIFAYLGTGFFAALIGRELLISANDKRKKSFFFFFSLASILGLQPLLVQANHVMVDNIAAAFALGSLFFVLRGRIVLAGLFMAGALGTRYMIWGAAPGALAALLWSRRPGKWKEAVQFTLIASLGAMPFLVRNVLLNSNPFFPLLNGVFNGVPIPVFDGWGRGKGFFDLLLFPFDLLYTNTFVREIYDTKTLSGGFFVYKVGTLFYTQLVGFLAAAAIAPKRFFGSLARIARDERAQMVLIFAFFQFFFWWFGSQQLRFLGCSMALLNLYLLHFLFSQISKRILCLFALAPILSIAAVQQETWKIAFGTKESFRRSGYVMSAERCFSRAGLEAHHVIGFPSRDVVNGFFNNDFVFLAPNNLHIASQSQSGEPIPDFIYSGLDLSDRPGFIRWPQEKPCLLKRTNL